SYSTLIGDMGNALSGGQQQRLLLARALYARPAILILDEATSHLDVATEQRIAAMLAELKITRIFAAHRPETVAIATPRLALEHRALEHRLAGRASRGASMTGNGSMPADDPGNKFGPMHGPKTEKGEMHVKNSTQ